MRVERAVALLSGGIDSPVACMLMMRQGVSLTLVHFKNESLAGQGVEEKIKDLARVLRKFQQGVQLVIVPFGKLQGELVKVVPAKVRMIVYRRVMFRIASVIARQRDAQAFVTGDSLGQVASQTLENIRVVHAAAELPVLTPLLGWDKQEIVDVARECGTYAVSVLPYADCCSFLVAKHPETKASLSEVEEIEKWLVIDNLIADAIVHAELF